MDSGAANSFLQDSTLKDMPMKPPEGAERDKVWTTSEGREVGMDGQRQVKFIPDEGEKRSMNMLSSSAVSKSLGAVFEMCDQGSGVLFTKKGGDNVQGPRMGNWRRRW